MTLYERYLIQVLHVLPYISNFAKPVEATVAYIEPAKNSMLLFVWNSLQTFSET